MTRIMGILNVTPDSFSDGGDHQGLAQALAWAGGPGRVAEIIDVGGESTRPGAKEVPAAEEIARTAPVIRALRDRGEARAISIDTRKASVAEAAIAAGATMINDVSALTFDPDLARVAATSGLPICLMHAQGLPETMQQNPDYRDVLTEVCAALEARAAFAQSQGIARDKIILDPGIGFGKRLDHNLALLRGLPKLQSLGYPVLLGASRKSFIGTLTGAAEPKDRLAGSLACALHAARLGVEIVRVHDVEETHQALTLWAAMQEH